MIRLGYPCQNLIIPASTNHTLRLAGVPDKARVYPIVEKNLENLDTILLWNAERDIQVFRIGSSLIPFASHPTFPYDWGVEHAARFQRLRELVRQLGLRVSIHPGQYVNPASPDPKVVEASLAELRYSARVLSLLDAKDGVLILHLGGAYGHKDAAVRRFVKALENEPEILRFLALENDERIWAVEEVASPAEALGVPVIVDAFHHRLNPGDLTLLAALDLAFPTWQGRPKVHISSQAPDKAAGAHADYIDPRDWRELVKALGGRDADVMVEAKQKDKALFELRRVFRGVEAKGGKGRCSVPVTDPGY